VRAVNKIKNMPFIKQEEIKPICTHPEHNPPTNYYYQPGIEYTYVCPACGQESKISVPIITC
jgi:hypothetical protein